MSRERDCALTKYVNRLHELMLSALFSNPAQPPRQRLSQETINERTPWSH